MHKFLRIYKKSPIIFGLISLSLLLVALFSFPVYAALTERSPNPSDVSSGGVDGGMSHLLKKETVALVTSLNLKIYYPANTQGNVSGEKLKILHGISGKKCLIDLNVVTRGAIIVTITGAGSSTKQYRVPIGQVCQNRSERNNVQITNPVNPDQPNNTFFANYDLPNNLDFDISTNKYVANVKIEYTGNVETGASNQNSVNFVTEVTNGNAQIGPVGNASKNDFGLRSAYFQEGRRDVRARVQFGIPCTENPTESPVRLYDADVGVFGPLYIYVTANGTALSRDEYTNSHPNAVWVDSMNDSGVGGWQSFGGSDSETVVNIKQPKYNTTYRFVAWNPNTEGTPASPTSNVLSMSIPYDSIYGEVDCSYNMTPTIDWISAQSYSYYPNIDLTSKLTTTGIIATDHSWRTYAVRYPSEPNMNIKGDSNIPDGNICAHRIPAGGSGCGEISSMSGGYPSNPAQTRTGTYNSGGPDAPGTRLCFFTVVRKPEVQANGTESDDNDWRYSDMKCAVSSKSPKVQIHGSDLKVNGLISTSLTPTRTSGGDTKVFGSWVEYGVFSTSVNSIASSGAGLREGSLSLPPASQAWSKLTFANTAPYGNYKPELSNAPALFEKLSVTGSLDTTKPSIAPGVYEHPGDLNLGSNLNISDPGKAIIIRVHGTVTINGNIDVNNNGRISIQDLSQVVILADHINIQGNVSNIDAWLLTRGETGRINTCSDVGVSAALTVGVCNNSLTVNGAVMTSQLYLRRTAGADATNPGAPAEVFRLRPDAQLWAYAYANKGDRAQTTYVTELPPRF